MDSISTNQIDEFRDLQIIETWGAWQVVTALVQALAGGSKTKSPTFNEYARAYGLFEDDGKSETQEDVKARVRREKEEGLARAARVVALDSK